MPKQPRKRPAKAGTAAKAPNPLDDVVEELERYEKGTPAVQPQACGDCPDEAACRKEDGVDDEH